MTNIKKPLGRPRKYPIKDVKIRYHRKESIYDAIKVLCRNGSDLKTILYHSNRLYVRHGGETMSNENSIVNLVTTVLDVLIEFNLIYKEGEIYKFYNEELEICREL